MGRKAKSEITAKCCSTPVNLSLDRCKVEALVSIDDRGQMVLPKDVRAKAGILPGDKLAVVSCSDDNGVYSLVLIKSETLSGIVQGLLGPMMGELKPQKGKSE
jgi:AbrB family looped-hinge helix DNA binding protein